MKLARKLFVTGSPQTPFLTTAIVGLTTCGLTLGQLVPASAALQSTAGNLAQATSGDLPKASERMVLRDAARRSGVPISQVKTLKITPKTFSNSCVFNFGDVCTREYRPIEGWEMLVQVGSQTWTYHIDRQGARIAFDPNSQLPSTDTAGRLPAAVETALIRDAIQRSRLSATQIDIRQATPRTFNNACIFNFGDRCTREYRPIEGWEVEMRVGSQTWTYHVDQSSTRIVLDPSVGATTGQLPSAVEDAVLRDAAQRSGLSMNRLKITGVTAKTFSNPCDFKFGEVCTFEYDPIEGWEVMVQVQNQSWTYHVSRADADIVLDPKVGGTAAELPSNIRNVILRDAVRRTGLAASNFQIGQSTLKTFSNPCEFEFGDRCTREYNPIEGWEVQVRFRNQTWLYHVDRSASRLALNADATSPVGSVPTSFPTNIRTVVLRDASAWTQLPTSGIQVLKAESKTWSNSCVSGFGRVCPTIYQPIAGWEVQVQANNVRWTYNVNQDGSRLMMDQRGVLPPQVSSAVLQEVVRRSRSPLDSLRFIQVQEQSRQVCTFIFNCRNESNWLTIVSDGRQQWGFRADSQGRNLQAVSVADVYRAAQTGNRNATQLR
jgi:uncharacterized protein YcnI